MRRNKKWCGVILFYFFAFFFLPHCRRPLAAAVALLCAHKQTGFSVVGFFFVCSFPDFKQSSGLTNFSNHANHNWRFLSSMLIYTEKNDPNADHYCINASINLKQMLRFFSSILFSFTHDLLSVPLVDHRHPNIMHACVSSVPLRRSYSDKFNGVLLKLLNDFKTQQSIFFKYFHSFPYLCGVFFDFTDSLKSRRCVIAVSPICCIVQFTAMCWSDDGNKTLSSLFYCFGPFCSNRWMRFRCRGSLNKQLPINTSDRSKPAWLWLYQ